MESLPLTEDQRSQASDSPVIITGPNESDSLPHQQQTDLDISLEEHSINESQSLPQQQQQQQQDLDLSLAEHSVSGFAGNNSALVDNNSALTSQPLLDMTGTGDSTVYLETPDRRRETEEAHRLFTKIKFILDTTRDEQNVINNQLKFLKEKFAVSQLVLVSRGSNGLPEASKRPESVNSNGKEVLSNEDSQLADTINDGLPNEGKRESEKDIINEYLRKGESSPVVEWEGLARELLNQDTKVYFLTV